MCVSLLISFLESQNSGSDIFLFLYHFSRNSCLRLTTAKKNSELNFALFHSGYDLCVCVCVYNVQLWPKKNRKNEELFNYFDSIHSVFFSFVPVHLLNKREREREREKKKMKIIQPKR